LLFGSLFAIYGYVQPVNPKQIDQKLELLKKSKTDTLLNLLAIIPVLVSVPVMGVAQYSGDYSGVKWWITVTEYCFAANWAAFSN